MFITVRDDSVEVSKQHAIVVYAKNGNGLYDELLVDVYNKHYQYTANIDRRELITTIDREMKGVEVGEAVLNKLYDFFKRIYSGSYYFEELDYDWREETTAEYEAKKASKPTISANKIRQALRCELTRKQMHKILDDEYRFEKAKYYDLGLMLRVVHAYMRGEISTRYFDTWCIVLCRCFYSGAKYDNENTRDVLNRLSWYLDGVSFTQKSSAKKRERTCREIAARFKYYDHEIRDAVRKTTTDFTTGGVITYVAFDFVAGDRSVDRVCIVDTERKKINYLYSSKTEYSERINYTFLSAAEFDDLPTRYYEGYELDPSMPLDYAAKQ